MSDSSSGESTKLGESSSSKSEAPAKDASKSARESVGGASEVHYGYFSNVRTESYSDGWDAIWSGKKKRRDSAPAKKTTNRKAAGPVTVSLDLDRLPEAVRDGLVAAARAKLARSRTSYDKSAAADRVAWTIECVVDR